MKTFAEDVGLEMDINKKEERRVGPKSQAMQRKSRAALDSRLRNGAENRGGSRLALKPMTQGKQKRVVELLQPKNDYADSSQSKGTMALQGAPKLITSLDLRRSVNKLQVGADSSQPTRSLDNNQDLRQHPLGDYFDGLETAVEA